MGVCGTVVNKLKALGHWLKAVLVGAKLYGNRHAARIWTCVSNISRLENSLSAHLHHACAIFCLCCAAALAVSNWADEYSCVWQQQRHL